MIYKLNDGQRHQDKTQSVAVDLALNREHRSISHNYVSHY